MAVEMKPLISTVNTPEFSQADSVYAVSWQQGDSGRDIVMKASNTQYPRFWRHWWSEIGFFFLSVSASGTLIFLLAKCNQQALAEWPLRFNINSIVAVLTTLAKACFMIPVSAALSQAQWSWFTQNRPLYDLHIFDQASRGSWGSLILLSHVRWRHVASIGALLTIVSVLTSPLTQLAIEYPTRNVMNGGSATTSILQSIATPDRDMSLRLRTAITLGAIENSTMASLVTCATGNCTFVDYETLGICWKTANRTSELQVDKFDSLTNISTFDKVDFEREVIVPGNTTFKVSLANMSSTLVHQAKAALLSEMLNWDDSSFFRNDSRLMQTRIASMYLVYTMPKVFSEAFFQDVSTPVQGIPAFRHEAVEIMFHLCVQSYSTVISKGVEQTQLIDSHEDLIEQDPPFDLKLDCTSTLERAPLSCQATEFNNATLSLQGRTKKDNDNKPQIFTATDRGMVNIAAALQDHLAGTAREVLYSNSIDLWGNDNRAMEELVTGVLYRKGPMTDAALRMKSIQKFYNNIAMHLTNSLRETKPNTPSQNILAIPGTAWQDETYISIRWGWIAFLAAEICVAAVFVCITIVAQTRHRHTSGMGIGDMKSSALAHAFALSDDCRAVAGGGAGGGVYSAAALEYATKQLLVRMDEDRLVRAPGSEMGEENSR